MLQGVTFSAHVATPDDGFVVESVVLGHNTAMHPQSIVFAGLTTPGNVLWQAGAADSIPAKKHEKVAWEKDPESVLSSHTRGAETRAHVVPAVTGSVVAIDVRPELEIEAEQREDTVGEELKF